MLRISQSKSSLASSLAHQLQQRCSVSGTAKGKAKLKSGQPLKRSKVSIKKGQPSTAPNPAAASSKGDDLESRCLNAPSPLRHLTAKEREREAEREKLGLISEARKVEMEMLKKQAKEGSLRERQELMGTPGLDLISLGLVDADKLPKYELTVEDGKRLAKEYSRYMMRRHRQRQAAESAFLKCKKEAIEALPEKLKTAALMPDMTPFPSNRFMATLTPPIEGYIDKLKEAAMQNKGKKKLR
uniref:Copper ion binding protein n=1 Tax=Kalanchoe fedtschenkoi TaxID=63787 RepID=A0A7N0UHY6_KALFE